MKSMIELVGALVLGFAGVASAEQVVVYEAPVGSYQQISASFEVNSELGRAWVDVAVQPIASGSEPVFAPPIERQVDGLYYDSAQKQVLYRTAAGPIVCAEDATALGATYLKKSTGNCSLIPSTEQRSVDDGFAVYERTVAKVILDAQTAPARLQAAAPAR